MVQFLQQFTFILKFGKGCPVLSIATSRRKSNHHTSPDSRLNNPAAATTSRIVLWTRSDHSLRSAGCIASSDVGGRVWPLWHYYCDPYWNVNMTNQIQARVMIECTRSSVVTISGVRPVHYLHTLVTTLQAVTYISQPHTFNTLCYKTVPLPSACNTSSTVEGVAWSMGL